jgi:protein gp37
VRDAVRGGAVSDQREGGIAWTDQTWNPIRGCSRVSTGCVNCYAEGVAARFSGPGLPYEGLAFRKLKVHQDGTEWLSSRWTGEVRMVPEHLADPLRRKRPRRIFVNSMSDLFHEKLSNEQIDQVFGVMWACRWLGRGDNVYPGHVFQVLTKRAARMREYMAAPEHELRERWARAAVNHGGGNDPDGLFESIVFASEPHPRIWLGVSAENQETADERIPELLVTPAAVRWVSAEPLLGPVDVRRFLGIARDRYEAETAAANGGLMGPGPWLDWIVVGGESGRKARQFDVRWAATIVEQCRAAGTPVFVKQMGANVIVPNDGRLAPCAFEDGEANGWPAARPDGKPYEIEHDINGFREEYQGAPVRIRLQDSHGGDMREWPRGLRIREFPRAP